VQYPFPLFRRAFLSVFSGTKKEALDIIFERLRLRYIAARDIDKVPSGIVVTPNLDHLRILFEDQNKEFQKVYETAFLQTPDGFPPLIQYGSASLGYQPREQITGIELFMQLINKIGQESLPYTIYLVGGFGNIPYKTRDYFTSIYPELSANFVGISTPPFGFLNNKEIMDTIAKDIDAKKPDIIFAGMTCPTQELFVKELVRRKVNFGVVYA
jgi:Teichoic acid biosynthesis proteins